MILHGWNLVSKVGSYRPEDTGFGRNDARFLRRHGFNTIRLGVIYKALEPQAAGRGRQAALPRRLPAQHRADPASPRPVRHLHAARLPPGPLQREVPGRGLARLAGRSTTASRPSRSRASPNNYVVNVGAAARVRQLLGEHAGRRASASRTATPPPGGTSPGASAASAGCSATTSSTSPGPDRRTRPASRRPAARYSTRQTLEPFSERVIAAIRKADRRTPRLVRAARHLRLRRRQLTRRHRRPACRLRVQHVLPRRRLPARESGRRRLVQHDLRHHARQRRQPVRADRRCAPDDRVRRNQRPRGRSRRSSSSPTSTR